MFRVLIYSALLILGMALSQVPAIDHLKPQISALTMIVLAYIMIQVGMEFEIDESQPRKYAVDYLVAMTAACRAMVDGGGFFWSFFYIQLGKACYIGLHK